jgi:hypothetical protein
MTVFLRVLDAAVDGKASALKAAVCGDGTAFDVEPSAFAELPGSPFAYWASAAVRAIFHRFPPFEAGDRIARKGLTTSDDERHVRVWWEPSESLLRQSWFTYAKGGSAQLFWSPIHTVVRWDAAKRTIPGYCGRPGRETPRVECADLMGRPGLTWPLRASSFSPSVLPAGSVFSARGYTIQAPRNELPSLLAITASAAFDAIFKLCLGRSGHPEFIVGVLQRLPLPPISKEENGRLGSLARRAWSLKRALDTTNETSHAFLLPMGLNEKIASLDRNRVDGELESLRKGIDEAGFSLYGITQEDRAGIEAASDLNGSPEASDDEHHADDADNSSDDELSGAASSDATISWVVGVAFGRFDPRLATGDRAIPLEPEPFDPLPSRSPGMWPEGEEPAQRADMLVDDEGHADDLVARVRVIADRVHVDVPENLRAWLAKEFLPLHIKMYSKSGRKAPIYWQLATSSASYSVWLYIHAFSKDTLFRVQNDYVAPKLAHEERRLEFLNSELRDGATAAQRNALVAQENLVEELRTFLEEVKRVAPLWNPNLDDGVIINFAPLWRLVPQNRSWQKGLKVTWDALCEGKYDWAHFAMRLWPERVVPKCAKDRSLAIAHALEDLFWVEGSDGKWTARKTPTRSIDELVRERTSPAVKSALKSLLDAPAVSGNAGGRNRGRRRRASGAAQREYV